MGLHLYFGGIGGSSLQPGNYDFRAYIGSQVIRTHCTIAPGNSVCKAATGFDGNVKAIYGYVDVEETEAGIVEIVMMLNEGRYTGGPDELLVRVVKDEDREWGPLSISPVYDRMTPADERCNVIDVSHTPIILEFPPIQPHTEDEGGDDPLAGDEDGLEDETEDDAVDDVDDDNDSAQDN